MFVSENVRMPPDHFGGDAFDNIAKIERTLLLCHLGVIDDLKQQIAQFLPQVIEVVPGNGVNNLVGFLEGVGRDGAEILLEVPRTAGFRGPQGRHDLDQAGNVLGRLHGRLGITPRRRLRRSDPPIFQNT